MREIVIVVPDFEPEQNVEIEVTINGRKRVVHYKVELLNFVAEGSPPKDKVTVLRHKIASHEKDWELVEIGAPLNDKVPLMFRKKGEEVR
jgi:hypothetical protein